MSFGMVGSVQSIALTTTHYGSWHQPPISDAIVHRLRDLLKTTSTIRSSFGTTSNSPTQWFHKRPLKGCPRGDALVFQACRSFVHQVYIPR